MLVVLLKGLPARRWVAEKLGVMGSDSM